MALSGLPDPRVTRRIDRHGAPLYATQVPLPAVLLLVRDVFSASGRPTRSAKVRAGTSPVPAREAGSARLTRDSTRAGLSAPKAPPSRSLGGAFACLALLLAHVDHGRPVKPAAPGPYRFVTRPVSPNSAAVRASVGVADHQRGLGATCQLFHGRNHARMQGVVETIDQDGQQNDLLAVDNASGSVRSGGD